MDGQAAFLGHSADGLEEVLALRRARLGVDHDVRGHDFADAFFDGVAEGVDLLEAGGARDADRGVDEVTVAGAAHAYAVYVQDAVHAGHGAGDGLLQALRGDVEQGVQGALAEARAHPQDYGRDHQTGDGVGVDQCRQIPGFAGPDQADSGNNYHGAPDVGGEVQGVGFQGFAGVFLGGVREGARASDVDGQGDEQD